MDSNYQTPATTSSPDTAYFNMQIAMGPTVCWLLFVITSWITFFEPDFHYYDSDGKHHAFLFWLYPCYSVSERWYDAIYINYVIFYALIIGCLVIITAGFAVYVYSIFIKKDGYIISAMYGFYSRFHLVPFLIGSILFILSESVTKENSFPDIGSVRYFLNVVFSIMGLGSMIFIYIKTNIDYPLWAKFAITRGAFSCLIALFSYFTLFSIYAYGNHLKLEDEDYEAVADWAEGCNYAFSFMLGIGNLCLSFLYKDIVLAGITSLMYLGMAINFFALDDTYMEWVYDDNKFIGVLDIIMLIAGVSLASYLFIRYRAIIFNNNP